MTARRKVEDVRREWPLIRRMDGRMEIICPHGVGHPSQVLTGARWVSSWMGVHGCCGCCASAAFALAERHHCLARGIEWPPPIPAECRRTCCETPIGNPHAPNCSCAHTFDRDGDLGEECCIKCGIKRAEVAAEGQATQADSEDGL